MNKSFSLVSLALRSTLRRPIRSILSASGVGLSVAALFSLLALQVGYNDGMKHDLDRLGAHILVVPKGCPYDAASIALHGARWPCYLSSAYLKQVRETAGVATAAPVFMDAMVSADGNSVVYEGIDRSILGLRQGWHIEGQFPDKTGSLLLGANAAQRRHWRPGMEVTLPEVPGSSVRVVGVLSPVHGPEDDFMFLPLGDAERRFGHPGELTHILVRLQDPDQLDATVARLHNCSAGLEMNVVPVAHLFQSIRGVVDATRVLLAAVALVAMLVAGAGVANTMAMAVLERLGEIGVLRAIGASRFQIFELYWVESLALSLTGSLVGILAATAGMRLVEAWVRSQIPMAPADPLLEWRFSLVLACLAAGALIGSVTGIAPALNAACCPPLQAMQCEGVS